MISIFTRPLESLARFEARSYGMPDLAMVTVPWPYDDSSAPEVMQDIADMIARPVKAPGVSA